MLSPAALAGRQTVLVCLKCFYVTAPTFLCPTEAEEQALKPFHSLAYPMLAGSLLSEYQEQQVGRKSSASFSSWKAGIAT